MTHVMCQDESSERAATSQTHHRPVTVCNLLVHLPFTHIYWLVVVNIFCVMFSSLSFDSLILLLIVSAGQLSKMAALPSRSP